MKNVLKYKTRSIVTVAMLVIMVSGIMVFSNGQAAMTKDFKLDRDVMTKYILATVKAARTIYVKSVLRKVKKAGLKATEDWTKQDHSVMLPAQFVKALGYEIQGYELSLVGSEPLYKNNLPKTPKEREMLAKLATSKEKMITFQDGTQYKGMSADFAISQGCADCHNRHANTKKRDWKKGDFMGAIIIRMRG
ncbi:MAG: c-type heme family protein [Nitrospirales bacterium]